MFRRYKKIILAVFLMSLFSCVIVYFRTPSFNIYSIDEMGEFSPSDRLLIFAPHCDDEALASSGLIMNAVAMGVPVKIVLVTNGDNNRLSTDIEFRTLYPTPVQFIEAGETRQKESLKAMMQLGLSDKDVAFLGFPDRGIKALYTRNWFSDKPYKSKGTKDTVAPYSRIYEPGVTYSGENLLRNIRKVIKEFSPTIVIAPDMNDSHPDHKYSAKFILMAMENEYWDKSEAARPILMSYLVHFYYFPFPRGLHPDRMLLPPFSRAFHQHYLRLMLTTDQISRKEKTIMMYKSQIKVPELGGLMKSFIRRNEIFEKTPYPREL